MFQSPFAIRAAIAATAFFLLAQSGSSALAASFPCNVSGLTPTQIAICSDDGLSALEQKVADIYSVQLAKLPANQQAGFIAQERAFLQKAEGCGINKTCIRNAYAARINELSPAPRPAPPAAAGPSFACSGPLSPTEIAICSDDSLAALDRQVTDIYSRKLASLPASQHQPLIEEKRIGSARATPAASTRSVSATPTTAALRNSAPRRRRRRARCHATRRSAARRRASTSISVSRCPPPRTRPATRAMPAR